MKQPNVRNYVHKYMDEFNKPKTHKDKKREDKNGKIKHKGKNFDQY